MKIHKSLLIQRCYELIEAYSSGKLGDIIMPEDSHPEFNQMTVEYRLSYFTSPMALNYQRDSYKLWGASNRTFDDEETRVVFDTAKSGYIDENLLPKYLPKYKLALQPNKHIETWQTICSKIYSNYGSLNNFFVQHVFDFLKIRHTVQVVNKKDFPYLSGPKIFNYWSYIIQRYGGITLKNSADIDLHSPLWFRGRNKFRYVLKL